MADRRMFVAAACCVVSGATALAQPTANHSLSETHLLLESCQSEAPTFRAMCLGYLAAISDEVRRSLSTGSNRPSLCPPAFVSLEAYRQAFIGFAKGQPDKPATGPAAEAARAAFIDAWTCR